MTVTVIGRTKVGEDNFYIVLQTDGTRAQIPQWMLLPEAADLAVHVPPRISLQSLQALHGELNVVLCSLSGAITEPGAEDEAQQRHGASRSIQQRTGTAGVPQLTPQPRRARGTACQTAAGSDSDIDPTNRNGKDES
jgi:hypothetical protein